MRYSHISGDPDFPAKCVSMGTVLAPMQEYPGLWRHGHAPS